MKKRVVAVLLSVMVAAVLVSCGKKEEEEHVDTSEMELAPLEEKAVSPAVESQAPESDPNAVGNMVYYPNSNEYLGALAGSNTLSLYFEKSGVTSGTGRITIYDESDYSMLSYVDVSDTSACRMAPIDNNGVQLSGWENGTQATLYFSKPFEAGKNYFVLMDAGCFKYESFESLAITNPSLMTIHTKEYGIASDIRDRYNFGDTATLSLIVGGACKRVLIQDYDSAAVLPSQTMLTSSGDVYFTFTKDGTYSFKVSFYDESLEIDSVTYSVTVSPTAADVSHDLGTADVPSSDSSSSEGSAVNDSSVSGVDTLN